MDHADTNRSPDPAKGRDSRFHGIPWWVIVVPSVMALAVLIYQAYTPSRLSSYQTHLPFTVTDSTMNPSHTLALTVVYPNMLALEEVPKMGRSLQVWLTDPQAGEPPRSYTVLLGPLADGVLFTDKNGTPLIPSATLRATRDPVEAGNWFLHRTPGDARQSPTVKLAPRVLAPDGTELALVSASTSGVNAISIQLETSYRAFWRHLLDVIFGPATPLLGLAVTLVGWFWSEREKERKRKEEEEQDRRKEQEERDRRKEQEERDRRKEQEDQLRHDQEEQRRLEQQERQQLNEITDLEQFWTSNPTAAVLRYLGLRREASADADSEAAGTLVRMWEQGWRTRIKQEAIVSLARGNYAVAHELAEALCTKYAGDRGQIAAKESSPGDIAEPTQGKPNEKVGTCALLALLSSESPSPAEKIQVIAVLAASRGELLPETLALMLAETFARALAENGALPKAVKELGEQDAARWLIAAPAVQQHLRERIVKKNKGSVAAQSLLNLAFQRIQWPRFWPNPAGASDASGSVTTALDRLGWGENPFGPERAEDDRRLFGEGGMVLPAHWVEPPGWSSLAAPGPTIVLSEAGYGRTTALVKILLLHQEEWGDLQGCPENAQTLLFPVFLTHEGFLQTRTPGECLGEMGHGVGRALLGFLALNPSLFALSTPSAQQAIARLSLACQRRLGDLGSYLRRCLAEHGDPGSSVPLWLPAQLRDVAAATGALALDSPAEVLFALREARPAGSAGFVVAVDVPARWRHRPETAALIHHLPPLVKLMPDLALCGVDLKLGLPASLAPAPELAAGVATVSLTPWPAASLDALRCKRLEGRGGFDNIMGPEEDVDLPAWIIQAAEGSPRRLVQLGNRLLARFESKQQGERLTAQDLEEIRRQVQAEPHPMVTDAEDELP